MPKVLGKSTFGRRSVSTLTASDTSASDNTPVVRRLLPVLAVALLVSFGVGCSHYAPMENGCMVDAAVKQAVYRQHNNLEPYYWSKILIVRWSNNRSPNSHALCAYIFKNHLLLYDYWSGSREVPICYRDNPRFIAQCLYGHQVAQAYFVEDSAAPRPGMGDPAPSRRTMMASSEDSTPAPAKTSSTMLAGY